MKTATKFLVTISFLMLMLSFQILKTQLMITVRNDLGNIEEGATVQLFEKEEDYKSEKNVAFEIITDKKGVAKFKDAKAVSYYVIVRKEDKDNSSGGEQTGKLEPNRINKVTIIIQ